MVDFIEDLGLAGIRFVNFSPTAERESKGKRGEKYSNRAPCMNEDED